MLLEVTRVKCLINKKCAERGLFLVKPHLSGISVSSAVIRVIADVIGVECIEKACSRLMIQDIKEISADIIPTVRPVVDGEADDTHVVSVKHAMAESDPLPLSNKPGRPHCDLTQPRDCHIRCISGVTGVDLREVGLDHKIPQLS